MGLTQWETLCGLFFCFFEKIVVPILTSGGRVAERTADDVRKPSVLAQLHAKQAERTAEPQKSQKRKSHNMEL